MLPLSAFGNHRLAKDGLAHRCKECGRKAAIIWNNTASGIFSRLKGRINHYKNKPFALTRDYFIPWYDSQKRICYYCGIAEEDLDLLGDHFKVKSSRLTVDCMDNERGYVPGNLTLACYRCNFLKSDELTPSEMYEFGQKYLKPKWQAKNRKVKI